MKWKRMNVSTLNSQFICQIFFLLHRIKRIYELGNMDILEQISL